MSKRDDIHLLNDIVEASRRLLEFTSGITYEDFLKDIKTQDAVVRNIEIIGEAAKNVSEETRAKFPTVPWKQVSGMRDKLIHHYFGVNFDVVWAVIKNDLGPLLENLTEPRQSGTNGF